MGLLPLEFTECLTDSPFFRQKLTAHEKELDSTSHAIKNLIREVKDVIQAARCLSKAQRNLSNSLQNFKFECIGNSQTDDEIYITAALKQIGLYIAIVEDERDRMMTPAYKQFVAPLENFRKKHIGVAKEGKKKFDKQTAKFCQSQERYLNLSIKKHENVLQEADASVEMERRDFHQASLQYVFRLQEVQERKKFEFVETLLGYMYSWLTFYHHGHELAKDFRPFMTNLQEKIQKTRENFDAAHEKAEHLMHKMLERKTKPSDVGCINKMYARQGYLFLLEKKALGTTWTKHYCHYIKDDRTFSMMPYSQTVGKLTSPETIKLKSCIRRPSESIEKRFCFDITSEDRPGIIYTLQALSEEDRQLWMNAMDGKEPTYCQPGGRSPKPEEGHLDEVGFTFVEKCISALEDRGLEEQGLYRLVGVSSKVGKLLQMGLDKRKLEKLNLEDGVEWECKTITSALKTYFRMLPEPLMTFRMHSAFISAAKQECPEARINDAHTLVHHLPDENIRMLKILIQHLCNVSAKSNKNLMTVSNLGVCFGPTLLRPEEESVTAIMEIKFGNIVVEILIDNFNQIFNEIPKSNDAIRRFLPSVPPPTSVLSARAPHALAASHAACFLNAGLGAVVSYDDSMLGGMGVKSSSSPGLAVFSSIGNGPPVPQPRTAQAHVVPLTVYNPLVPSNAIGNNVNGGSNSSSSLESVNSKSSRELNHHPAQGRFHHPPERPSHPPEKISSRSRGGPDVRYGSIGRHLSKGTSSNALLQQSSDSITSISSLTSANSGRQVRTLYHCVGENQSELSFEPNEIIVNVRPSREPGWLEGNLKGISGLIPENYIEYLP